MDAGRAARGRSRSARDARPQFTGGAAANGAAASPHVARQQHLHKENKKWHAMFRIRRQRVPGPGPRDDRRPGEGDPLSDFYGEIANASVKETKRGDDTTYEFQRRVGTKGAFTSARS